MKNLIVYVKNEKMKKFVALSSLKNFTFAPSLMYACLIPYNKLDRLKKWCDSLETLCNEQNVKIEIRHYKGKSLYSVGK